MEFRHPARAFIERQIVPDTASILQSSVSSCSEDAAFFRLMHEEPNALDGFKS